MSDSAYKQQFNKQEVNTEETATNLCLFLLCQQKQLQMQSKQQ